MPFNKPKLISSMAIGRYRRYSGLLLAVLAFAIAALTLIPPALLSKLLNYLPLRCPVNFLFGWHCPTCGLGRATIALLRGDFAKSWAYHPAALILTIGTVLLFIISVLFPQYLDAGIRKARAVTKTKIYPIISGYYLLASIVGLYFIWGLVRTLPQ